MAPFYFKIGLHIGLKQTFTLIFFLKYLANSGANSKDSNEYKIKNVNTKETITFHIEQNTT